LIIIDRLKETVRLSEGLQSKGDILPAARSRALDCLSRFGERLRDMHASNVRAAGTSTLRRARDSRDFCRTAEKRLGHPIDVISGLEEARLIFSGVVHSTPPYEGHRLVLDIGGGSTELILGQGTRPRALESLHMGCVVTTERYFGGGRISRAAFDDARLAVRLKLRPVKAFFRDVEDVLAIGASGTIRATERIARSLSLIGSTLTLDAVEELIGRVIEFERLDDLSLPGLSAERAQVWPGGLAILVELMIALRIDRVSISDGALREGLLYESIGRLQHEDARERSVRALASRYSVDPEQADRVRATAAGLLADCASSWDLQSELATAALAWAARLHEIGLDINHVGFQRHGAYIAANADLPGFPRSEQDLLAFLIASQRRQIDGDLRGVLPSSWQKKALRLAILLRLAVLLHRSRSRNSLPPIAVSAGGRHLKLEFPKAWLDDNPLTIADLAREQAYLRDVGYELDFS
ncbi:MAG: Ppx/GppA phosphatase family protein, partial [Woeseiaceae bacterium]|nr:Ppx/GppA phosphatase family protein [Woeseiaceae bacterium]